MRVLLIAAVIAAAVPTVSLAQTDPDVLKAARECADRSIECRRFVEGAERQTRREDAVLTAIADLGRAIGYHYSCNAAEAGVMERMAKADFSAALPGRERDVTAAVDRGIASVPTGTCRPSEYQTAMQRYSEGLAIAD